MAMASVLAGGTGKVYGLDLSSYCTSRASHVLRHLIRAQKLDITPGSVQDLPYSSASMDCAFHVNAFFFWPDIGLACSELRRVLRPGGRLVCTQDLAFYRMLKQRQLLPMICVDPLHYMHMLEAVGFTDVRTEYFSHKGREYPAIMAVASSDLPPDRPLVDR